MDYEYFEYPLKAMIDVDVRYHDKDQARKLGAKWNSETMRWQVREDKYDNFIKKFKETPKPKFKKQI